MSSLWPLIVLICLPLVLLQLVWLVAALLRRYLRHHALISLVN
jgi:hypothetical protein